LGREELLKVSGETPDSVHQSSSPLLLFSPSLLGFYFFIGLALLAKGLVGIVFPFAIVSFYYLLSWKLPPKAMIVSLFWGTALAVLVSCSWYVPMYQKHGWAFIDEFFIQHHFQRYTSNKYLHPQPFFFFLWVLPLMTIPWLPFFIASLWNFIPKKSTHTSTEAESGDGGSISPTPLLLHSSSPLLKVRRFAAAWLLVPLVFFSFSGSKLPGYVLPALPAAMILASEYAWRFTRKGKMRRVIVQIVAAGTLAVVILSATFLVNEFAAHESVKALIARADAEGHSKERVINLFGMSHNSEFYAPGRLVRTPDGKQKMYFSVAEIVDELKAKNETSGLVLVPLRHLEILTKYPHVESTKIADNGEFALMTVTIK
jgi:hypothetical protein